MPMLMKYEHLCFYLIPSANRGTNKGFLDSCHYNFSALEVCHYYSLYWKIAITILHTSHPCPHLRLLPTWAHCQGGICVLARIAPLPSLKTEKRGCADLTRLPLLRSPAPNPNPASVSTAAIADLVDKEWRELWRTLTSRLPA